MRTSASCINLRANEDFCELLKRNMGSAAHFECEQSPCRFGGKYKARGLAIKVNEGKLKERAVSIHELMQNPKIHDLKPKNLVPIEVLDEANKAFPRVFLIENDDAIVQYSAKDFNQLLKLFLDWRKEWLGGLK